MCYNILAKETTGQARRAGKGKTMNGTQISFWGESAPTTIGKSSIERLREKAELDRGLQSFDGAETLALLISNVHRDGRFTAEGIAIKLIETFGSMKGVFEARPEQLRSVPGVTERIARLIAQQLGFIRAWERATMDTPTRIGSSRDAEAYCRSLLAGERNENFFVISLNAQCQRIGTRRISSGSLSEVSAYPRLVIETALNHNAHSVILTHNHPGGTCAPSPEDLASTQQLQRLLQGIGIILLDHIIVAGKQTYSMIQHGDIDYRIRNRT